MSRNEYTGRAIKIAVDGKVTEVADVPLRRIGLGGLLFGGNSLVELVRPVGLEPYNAIHGFYPRLIMLVDEEGLLKDLESNLLAGVLYGAMTHGHPICGDAYIIAENLVPDDDDNDLLEPDFEGLPPDVTTGTVFGLIGRVVAGGA